MLSCCVASLLACSAPQDISPRFSIKMKARSLDGGEGEQLKLAAETDQERQEWMRIIAKMKEQVPKEEEEDDPYRECENKQRRNVDSDVICSFGKAGQPFNASHAVSDVSLSVGPLQAARWRPSGLRLSGPRAEHQQQEGGRAGATSARPAQRVRGRRSRQPRRRRRRRPRP